MSRRIRLAVIPSEVEGSHIPAGRGAIDPSTALGMTNEERQDDERGAVGGRTGSSGMEAIKMGTGLNKLATNHLSLHWHEMLIKGEASYA